MSEEKYRRLPIEELDNLEILPYPNLTIREDGEGLLFHYMVDKRVKELLEYLKCNYELKKK